MLCYAMRGGRGGGERGGRDGTGSFFIRHPDGNSHIQTKKVVKQQDMLYCILRDVEEPPVKVAI